MREILFKAKRIDNGGWALGVKGERIDDKEDTSECERNL